MTTLQLAKDAVRAMDEAERKYADGDLSQGAKDNIIIEAADNLRAYVRSLPEPGDAVAWLRYRPDGTPDWAEDCVAEDDSFLDFHLAHEGYTLRPLFAAPVGSEDAAILRQGVELFTRCADDYQAAVVALTAIHPNSEALHMRSPAHDSECYAAWLALNNAGARLRECTEKLREIAIVKAATQAKEITDG